MFQGNIEKTTDFSKDIFLRGKFNDKLTVTPTVSSFNLSGDIYWYLSYPYFVIKMTSQFTNKSKVIASGTFFPSTNYANEVTGTQLDWERQMAVGFKYTTGGANTENLKNGAVHLATDEFPLGFYDITIYENKTSYEDNNLANATATLFNGVLNLKGSESDIVGVNMESVQYVDYTTNDTETQSVYITF